MRRRKVYGDDLTCRGCGRTPADRGDPISERAFGYLCRRCLMARPNVAGRESEDHIARIKRWWLT
jgi:hypothetical protein